MAIKPAGFLLNHNDGAVYYNQLEMLAIYIQEVHTKGIPMKYISTRREILHILLVSSWYNHKNSNYKIIAHNLISEHQMQNLQQEQYI